ncbi:MAG: carboxylate-amine ligase [Steroidobacteraceae bacterium]
MVPKTVRFGIEEELFVSNPSTQRVVVRSVQSFQNEIRREFGDRVSSELLQSQIELKTNVLSHVADAFEALAEHRRQLCEIAARHDLEVLAAGTHPLAGWRTQRVSTSARYEALVDDFQIVAHRTLLCGLHIHAEIPPEVDRIRLMNELMRWLPLWLALSASSPFWDGRDTGLMSYRQAAYDEWPRTGIPRLFDSEAEYKKYVDTLVATKAIADESYIWWTIRPSARYPTLELRIADSCPLYRDSVCVAELFRTAVLQALINSRDGRLSRHSGIDRLLIEENRWRAKRFGTAAEFIDLGTQENRTAVSFLNGFVTACAEAIGDLDSEWAIEHASMLIASGSSAHRQRAVYLRRVGEGDSGAQAVRAVVQSLATETREGRPALNLG